ncbi:hypothetical protein [Parachitinimonas caeni]|uniref:VacJ n=1 Tax=Parachitinimonas caeni TaxID=3031301 RepID=A0ABT7DTD7_9NEIS|nr:hypothetical protein [Parachitinimonas caeni]MDK2123328.1 hypothetical protein [Parachitinimonas caeni]
MYFVDRSIAVIKPKQPFLDWLNGVPENDIKLSLADIRNDCTVLMIPEVNEQEDGISYIDDIADKLFEMELASWYEDESVWPQKRTLKLFWEWFDVEIHSMLVDTLDSEIQNSPQDVIAQ